MHHIFLISAVALCSMTSLIGTHEPLKSTEGDELQTLIEEFSGNEKYTKKTQIFLKDAALEDAKDYFHAGSVSLKRRTYYDETADALLMDDYDGGFSKINSGYAKNGSNMEHYQYADSTSPDVDTLFSARTVDYTVNDTTPKAFFVFLSSIASEVKTQTWSKTGSLYTYSILDLSVDGNGDYNDHLLHKIQYFVAPLLLQSIATAYLSPDQITIEKVSSDLVIKLYVSSDEGKISSPDGKLLAEAVISKGLILS